MYQTYWIQPCLQVIPIYFLTDENINYLFQTERRTSARGSLDGSLHCVNAVNFSIKSAKKFVYMLLKPVFFPSNL